MELASKYNPADVEGKWYQYWLDHKLFSSNPMVVSLTPSSFRPPNVRRAPHRTHANNTIQDILVRVPVRKVKMPAGVPGTDHASIATEAKVVNKLKLHKVSRRWILP